MDVTKLTNEEKRKLLDECLKREPVVEELITKKELEEGMEIQRRIGIKFKEKIVGYRFWCPNCEKVGILKNKYQLFCPKCSIPFFGEVNLTPINNECEEPVDYIRLAEILEVIN